MALPKKLGRFISQVAPSPGAPGTLLSAPGPGQNAVAGSPSSWQADRNVSVLFPNTLVSLGKGTARLGCDRSARQPTLSHDCLDLLCVLTSLTPWTFLLVKRRIRASFQSILPRLGVLVCGKKGLLKQMYVEMLCLAAEPASWSLKSGLEFLYSQHIACSLIKHCSREVTLFYGKC